MSRFTSIAIATVALATIVLAAIDAQAQSRGGRYAGPPRGAPDYVVAESRFGNGTVAGFVRRGSNGLSQVRLPGGTWIDCRRSCTETLRVESIDFWENRGAGERNRIDNECGIFGCLSRSYRF